MHDGMMGWIRTGCGIALVLLNQELHADAISISGPSSSLSGSYSLGWTRPANHQVHLQRRINGGNWSTIASNGTTYSTDAESSGQYEYRVKDCYYNPPYPPRPPGPDDWICEDGPVKTVTVVRTPGMPGAVSFTPANLGCNTGFMVNWGLASGANRYQIQRSNNDGSTWSLLDSNLTSSNWPESTTLTAGADYLYRVRARYTLNGYYSAWTSYRTSATIRKPYCPPNPPTNIDLPSTPSKGVSVSFSWRGASGTIHSYQWRQNGGAWQDNGMQTDKTLPNLNDGFYVFSVRACNVDGCGNAYSAPALEIINPPVLSGSITIPTGLVDGSSQYTVSWSQAGGQVEYYDWQEIYNGNNGVWQDNGLSKQVTRGPQADGQYRYAVRACHDHPNIGCGNSLLSAAFNVLNLPGSMAMINGQAMSRDGILSLSWTAPTGQSERYELREDEALIQNSGATTITRQFDPAVLASYIYRVRACNAIGCGLSSPPKTVIVYNLAEGWLPLGQCDPQNGLRIFVCKIAGQCDGAALNSVRYGFDGRCQQAGMCGEGD